jgi:ATP-binding protein involved in chromosome partitioning
LPVLGKLPLLSQVSDGGDAGRPVMVQSDGSGPGGEEVRGVMRDVAESVWGWLGRRGVSDVGVRG